MREGLTPVNASAYDDLFWAVAGCRGLTHDRQEEITDLAMQWALAAQARGAV